MLGVCRQNQIDCLSRKHPLQALNLFQINAKPSASNQVRGIGVTKLRYYQQATNSSALPSPQKLVQR